MVNYAQRVTLVLLCGFSLFFLNPTDLSAGDYHNTAARGAPSATLACSQCHTMHYSQGGSSLIYPGTGGVDTRTDKLLRAGSILQLCLYCHGKDSLESAVDGNKIPPRVEYTRSLTANKYTPSAGDFLDRGALNEANRHSIGTNVSGFLPPGYSGSSWGGVTARFSTTFNCLFCHAQHGNENYRNLRYDPGNPVQDDAKVGADIPYITEGVTVTVPAGKCNNGTDPPCDVYIVNTTAYPDDRWKYNRANVTFGISSVTNTEISGISVFCGKCHGDFYGLSGAGNMGGAATADAPGAGDTATAQNVGDDPWVRHPVGDIQLGQSTYNLSGHIDGPKILANSLDTDFTMIRLADGEVWPPVGYDKAAAVATVGKQQPFCLSCHYAHGGGNANHGSASPAGLNDQSLDHSMLVFTDLEGDVNIEPTDAGSGNPGFYGASNDEDISQHFMRNTCNQCHNQ